jgi:hypothetical protein
VNQLGRNVGGSDHWQFYQRCYYNYKAPNDMNYFRQIRKETMAEDLINCYSHSALNGI